MRHALSLAIVFVALPALAQSPLDRLPPPIQVAVPPAAEVMQPQTRPVRAPEKLPTHLWQLPTAISAAQAQSLPGEQSKGNFRRPAFDVPSLAAEPTPTIPAAVQMPASPRSFVVSGNPDAGNWLVRYLRVPEGYPRPVDDPTADVSRVSLLVPLLIAAPEAPPLLRLRIPEPFEQVQAVRLATSPPDNESPAASLERGARPVLSTQP